MTSDHVVKIVEHVLRPGCFFVADPLRLRIEHVSEQQIPWEVFRGHLLDPAHAGGVATFESWNLFLEGDSESPAAPLLAVRWQREQDRIHIIRQLLTHGFEAYEDLPGVILSRGVHKWVAELVGTIEVSQLSSESLAEELTTYLLLAVIGTSRLPITSLESPLPAFSLGQMAYFPGLSLGLEPFRDAATLVGFALESRCQPLEQAKSLEMALRAATNEEWPRVVQSLRERIRGDAACAERLSAIVRTLFNGVALSPYTHFADRLISLLVDLSAADCFGAASTLDLLGYMLRHLVRHLTAFDLSMFHNFGANYPDALFLDALLKAYLRQMESNADLLLRDPRDSVEIVTRKRLRRRALRQACLVRKQYEGHRVPDAPTSMGENLRVLPAPFARVPDEQISHVAQRRRTLFEGDPLEEAFGPVAQRVLDAAIGDLDQPLELQELGMAHFLDRPLGTFKEPGEIDRTQLLAYEAFSRSIAKQRLAQLERLGWSSSEQHAQFESRLPEISQIGVESGAFAPLPRPGVVSLADAAKAAPDFRFLRTTRQSLADLLSRYDLRLLAEAAPRTAAWLTSNEAVLLVLQVPAREALAPQKLVPATLRGYDRQARLRVEFGFALTADRSPRYRERAGVELVDPLQVLRVWDHEPQGFAERDLREASVWLTVR